MIKKPLLILTALICSLIAAELLIGNILGFPKYGVLYKMKGMRSSPGHQNIYKPHSEYWNSRGKFEIYRRNNIGLPGADIDTADAPKYVYVMGSSFIENQFLKPEAMSTTVFQNQLKNTDRHYNVLNLGYAGFDPYDSYRRMCYYENAYKPECEILVINGYKAASYKLADNPFELNRNSFSVDNSFKSNINLFFRNNFSFIRLVSILVQEGEEQTVKPVEDSVYAVNADLTDLNVCLGQFGKRCGDKFLCVSIMRNDTLNNRIDAFCKKNNVNFEYSNIMIPENQMSGDWHLNEKGNIALGNFLFASFQKYYNTKK
ncbi:MAG: hypothetical protein PHN88_09730 [Ignavibacteria bacterium]|nr:hypothetical protein [Ignavibacteria bacterium]